MMVEKESKKASLYRGDDASETRLREILESMGYRCSRYAYPPGTVFDFHNHAVDKIDAVVAGCFRITVDEGAYDLGPGDYVMIPRGVMHRAEVIGDETVISLDGVKE